MLIGIFCNSYFDFLSFYFNTSSFNLLGDIDDLLREIMSEARRLTNSERCSLFLLDHDHQNLVAKVFDGVTANTSNLVRISKDQGIAGKSAY